MKSKSMMNNAVVVVVVDDDLDACFILQGMSNLLDHSSLRRNRH
jgi:hypothetical protein